MYFLMDRYVVTILIDPKTVAEANVHTTTFRGRINYIEGPFNYTNKVLPYEDEYVSERKKIEFKIPIVKTTSENFESFIQTIKSLSDITTELKTIIRDFLRWDFYSAEKCLINILYSAIIQEISQYEESKESPEYNDIFRNKFRGLMSLIFSVLRTSDDKSLNSVYNVLLNKHYCYGFFHEIKLIDILLNLWPLMEFKDDIKNNILESCNLQIHNIVKNRVQKQLLPNSEVYFNDLRYAEKQIALFNVIRPLVIQILSLHNSEFANLEEMLIRYKEPITNHEETFLLIIPQTDIPIQKYFNYQKLTTFQKMKKIENEMKEYIKQREEKEGKGGVGERRRRGRRYIKRKREKTMFNQRKVKIMREKEEEEEEEEGEEGENGYDEEEDNDEEKLKILHLSKILYNRNFLNKKFNKDYLLLTNLEELSNYEPLEMWKNIKFIACHYYLKKSILFNIFIEEMVKILNKIIKNKLYNLRHVYKFKTYFEKEENEDEEEDEEEEDVKLFIQLRKLRASLFDVFFILEEISFDGERRICVPEIIQRLSECVTLQDFLYMYVGENKIFDELWNEGWRNDINHKIFNNTKLIKYCCRGESHFNNLEIEDFQDRISKNKSLIQRLYIKLIEDITEHTFEIEVLWKYCQNNDDDDDIKLYDKVRGIINNLIPLDLKDIINF